ncbi:MAG: hypothetical protein ACLR8O_02225, partial [Streptococcus thermophilus]
DVKINIVKKSETFSKTNFVKDVKIDIVKKSETFSKTNFIKENFANGLQTNCKRSHRSPRWA